MARGQRRCPRGGRAALAVLAAAAAAVWRPSAGWVSSPSWRRGSPRAPTARRAGDVMDFLLGFLPKDPDSTADSAADSPASTALEATSQDAAPPEEAAPGTELNGRWGDMKVGDTVDGKVSFRNNIGVFVKLENGKTVRALVPRDDAFRQLKPKQELKGMTVESLSSRSGFVSVPGLPKLQLTEDLKVGDTVDGYVAWTTAAGVFVNIGRDRKAKVLARRVEAFQQLKKKQELKGMTVESVSERGVLVSVPGLQKLKLIEDFEVGDAVEGRVAGVGYLDVGAETVAKISGPFGEVRKLSKSDELQGVTVEAVDVKRRMLRLTVPGLSELVAGREAPKKKPKRKQKQPAAPKQKSARTSPSPRQKRREQSEAQQTSAQTQEALDMRTIVVDGDNLQGKKIKIQLKGGLEFDSISKSGKTVKLVRK